MTTQNPTFSDYVALPDFGHPFMFSDVSTSDSGNGDKWAKAVLPELTR